MIDRGGSFLERRSRRLFVTVHGDGPPLFYAHGLAGTHRDAAWLAEIAGGFTLITPDLYGRGASHPAPQTEEHTFGEHAEDVMAILDHLGVDDAIIGGTSFGAAVALAFAVRYPMRVRALVLLASAFGSLDGTMEEGDLRSYRALGDRMAEEGVRAVAESEAARVNSRRPVDRWTQHDETSIVAFMRAVPLYRPVEHLSDVAVITAPALVIPGSDDIHRPELSAAFAAALPNAELIPPSAPLADAVTTFLDRFRHTDASERRA